MDRRGNDCCEKVVVGNVTLVIERKNPGFEAYLRIGTSSGEQTGRSLSGAADDMILVYR